MHQTQPRSYYLFALAAAVTLVASVSDHAHGQFPIAVKTLTTERIPGTLNVAPTAAGTDSAALAGQTVSNDCRNQYVEAKKEWEGKPENKGKPLVSFGCSFGWRLQLATNAKANEYFGDFGVGNAVALTYGDKQSALYTELLSDNLWLSARLGYARVGLSAQLAGSGASDESATGGEGDAVAADEAGGSTINQLFQGGGNASLHLTMPLYVWINFVGETEVDKTPVRRFDSFATLATGLDIPELNAAVESRSGNLRLGWQGVFTARTFSEEFRFFAQGNTAYVIGFNDGFYANLLGSDITRPRAGLGLVRGTVGLEIARIARVGVSFGTTTIKDVRQPARLTVQLIDSR